MPFTFSHPAIVLPLSRIKWLSLTGLVIGSMTPDFEYFIRMKIRSTISHTDMGILYFNLPVGIMITLIFHNVIRNPLYNNLPLSVAQRLIPYTLSDFNQYFKSHWWIVVGSIFIGAVSHLFWDSFTHSDGYFVAHIPGLNKMVGIFGHRILLCRVLQHVSTVIGGLAISYFIYRLPADTTTEVHTNRFYWPLVIGITAAIIGIRLAFGIDRNFIGQFAGTSISAFLIALILTPIFLKKK